MNTASPSALRACTQLPLRRVSLPLACAAALLALRGASPASSFYWSGDNNSLWNTTGGANGTNWSSLPGSNSGTLGLPGSADDVFFAIPGALNLNTQLGADFSIQSLTFTPVVTSPVSIGGANLLTLGSGGLTNNTNAAVTLDTNVALGATQTWANNSSTPVTVNGVVSGGAASDLTIGGNGAFTFTNANTYSGNTTIFTGTLNLSGANGSIRNTSSVTLNAGTRLVLDSSTANNSDRLNDDTTITSRGGILSLVGNAAGTTEAAGTLSVGSGASVVQISGTGSTLSFGRGPLNPSPLASFSRTTAGGTANFVVGAGASIKAPNVTLVNGIIGGWAVTGTAAGTGLNWATVDGSDNIVPYSGYTTLTGDGSGIASSIITATDNTKYDATGNNSVRLQGNTTVSSLYMTGGSTLSGVTGGPTNLTFYNGITFGTGITANLTITLTIGSGGIISSGATGIGHYNNKTDISNMAFIGYQFGEYTAGGQTNGDAGQITAEVGVPDLIVYTDSNLRIASRIVDNGGPVGLTKSGPGVLDLSNGNTQTNKPSNTFTGKVAINEGILAIGQGNQLGSSPAASDNVTFNGGELRTFAGLNTTATQGWTVGTRGGTFSYSGGGTSNIQNKITGVGGFTFYARSSGGGVNEIINLANNLAPTGGGNADYQGPTNLWWAISDGSFGSGSQYGRIAWTQNNQIPAASAMTMNIVDDTPAHNVLPNSLNVSADLAGRTDHFGSLAGNVNIRNFTGTLTIGANNLSTLYTGSIYGAATQTSGGDVSMPAGTGTLVKVGSGTQTFAGTISRYTGPTNINGGKLLIGSGTGITSSASLGTGAINVGNGSLTGSLGGNGTILGAVTVTSTGHLAPAMSASTTNTLTISNNLTLNAGASLDYNFGTSGTPGISDSINITGSLLLNAGTDVLNITPLPGFGIGTYNLITSTGSFTDNATFTINGSTLFNYFVLKPGEAIDPTAGGGVVPAGQLRLQVLAGNPNFFWTGAVNGTWDVNTTSDWTGAGPKFTAGGNVTFDDANLSVAPPGATTITVAAGGVTANSIVFSNSTNNYSIGGAAITVTAGAGITKNQAGTITLKGSVTTPLTTINAGTLSVDTGGMLNSALIKVVGGTLSVAGALGGTTSLNVGGIATFTSAAQTLASLSNDSGITTGVLNLNGPTALTIGTGGYDGRISGAGSLAKNTAATLTLTNAGNNFMSGVTVLNGILSVPLIGDAGTSQPLGAGTGNIVLGDVATVGTLQYTGSTASTNRGFTIAAGGGGIEVTSILQELTLTSPINNGANTATLLGAGDGILTGFFSGTGNVVKQGTGTWTLANTTTPSGATPASIYTVQAGRLTGESDGLGSSLGTATIALTGGTLGLSSSAPATFDNAVNVNQTSTINAFQSVSVGGQPNQTVNLGSVTSPLTIAAGRVVTLSTANGYSLNLAGNITGGGGITANGLVNISGTTNNYTGPTLITGGTVFAFTAINATSTVTVNNGATFNVSAGLTATGAIAVTSGTLNAFGTVTTSNLTVAGGVYNGNATLNSAGGLTVSNGAANIVAPTGLGNGPINIANGLLKLDVGFGNTATYGGPSVNNDALLQVASGTADFGNTIITTAKPHATPGTADQLAEAFFNPANAGVADFGSGANGDPLITFENTNNFLTRPPGSTGILQNTNLNFTGTAVQLRSNGLFVTDTNQEGAVWHGRITVGGPNLPAGPISFATNTDDGSSLYIDQNQNGNFEASERVITNFGSHGVAAVTNTITLAAGTYRIAIGWYNGTGGLQTDASFAAGSGIPFASQAFINPGSASQLGVFSSPSAPGGRIQIDPGAALSAGGFTADAVIFTNGFSEGTLALMNNVSPVTSAADSITVNGSNGFAALNFGSNNTVNVVAVNLGVDGTLTKTGNGTLIVTGAGTGTGTLVAAGGPLVVNGSITGAVNVTGGTLKGTGTVGKVTLTTGALAPGNSPGILNSADLTLGGGTLALEIGGSTPGNTSTNYDQLNVTGSVTLNAAVTLTLDFSTYDPVDNVDTFVIVNNDLADGIVLSDPASRLFFGATQLNEGVTFLATSGAFTQQFRASYIGGDGNDISLVAIPEPSSIALLIAGSLSLLAGRPRRKS